MLRIVPLLLLSFFPPPGKELMVASSPEEPALILRIRGLSQSVSDDDARRVTACAVTTGRELARQWHAGWLAAWQPGLQNLFIKMGTRKQGYCFQYSAELLRRLDALKLPTVEFHWGESEPGTTAENNAVIVTARGQPFQGGVVLDNWRAQGHLVWTQVTRDPEYHWKENKAYAASVLQKGADGTPPKPR